MCIYLGGERGLFGVSRVSRFVLRVDVIFEKRRRMEYVKPGKKNSDMAECFHMRFNNLN